MTSSDLSISTKILFLSEVTFTVGVGISMYPLTGKQFNPYFAPKPEEIKNEDGNHVPRGNP